MKSLKCLYKIGYGPSSSHTMGPALACELFKKEHSDCFSYKVVLFGSLALTGKGHFTDEIVKKTFAPKETDVVFNYDFKDLRHPNTFDLIAVYKDKEISKRFYSIGGGDLDIEGEEKKIYPEVYPHKSFKDIKEYINKNQISLVDYVEQYEERDIRDYLLSMYNQMISTIKEGLKEEGVLPGSLKVVRKAKSIYDSEIIDESLNINKNVYAYAFATSEQNASGNLIVTAPTCGSCGVMPAVLYDAELTHNYSKEKIINALMVGGIIGNLVKENASISGAEAGCQAEIGTACAMASSAYAYLLGANIDEIEQAAEIALEHHLGLTCDPIGGYVQIPCIERNAVCAIRAIDCAKLVIFIKPGSSKISFDLVVKTMFETGRALNQDYRETSLGGLAKEYNK